MPFVATWVDTGIIILTEVVMPGAYRYHLNVKLKKEWYK